MSACVTVCVAWQTTDAPGSRMAGRAGVHVPSTAAASVTVTPVRVWFPVFVTVIAKVIDWPTASYGPAEVRVFATVIAGVCWIGTVAVELLGGVWAESATAVFE